MHDMGLWEDGCTVGAGVWTGHMTHHELWDEEERCVLESTPSVCTSKYMTSPKAPWVEDKVLQE